LNDLLLSDDEDADGDANMEGFEGFDGEGESTNPIVMQLEEQARMVPEKKVRKQSVGEKEWVKNLVVKWGSNYKGMMRDRKLNPMQQTEADIRRRVEKWRAEGGSVVASA
jgi:nucleolar protein 16